MTEPSGGAFATPARRSRQRSSVGSNSSNGRRRSSLLSSGTESELTPGGTQILHAGLKRSGRALALQVLGVYRYIADPVLRSVLPADAADVLERDVFDLVVSDGQMKMKALLSPALNHLVWRGLVSELDIVEIDDYELLSVFDTGDDDVEENDHTMHQPRSVCIIHELTPRAPLAAANDSDESIALSTTTQRAKIVYSVGRALLASPSPSPSRHNSSTGVPDLQFIADGHIRDHGALPLAGTRLYYLSLFSDDYPAEWEPVEREALSPVSLATPWAEWNRRRRYCTDIFTSRDRTLHTLHQVNALASRKRLASEMDDASSEMEAPQPTLPPMIGVVDFKSGLVHLGDPSVENEFPFMFSILLTDRERSMEITFFGSMAAKHFLVVQEGDVIQLQGYYVSRSAKQADGKVKRLFYFPHLSTGVVSHVPDKYWQLLEAMNILEKRSRIVALDRDDHGELHQPVNQSIVWLEPTFVTTREAQQANTSTLDDQMLQFDFVGVATYVSRMHRYRPEREGSPHQTVERVSAYRWLKLIDCYSKSELVVRLFVNSQPTAFHAIQAGDTVMLSKLQWVRIHDDDGDRHFHRVEFASSSLYTTIRRNDDVEPYRVVHECAETVAFAKALHASGDCRTKYSAVESPLVATTESWLEGPAMEGYEPLYPIVSMADSVEEARVMLDQFNDVNDPRHHWIPTFSASTGTTYPFDDVEAIAESMDAMSHKYLRVRVALHDIRAAPASPAYDGVPDIEFLVTDRHLQDRRPQSLRLRSNLLLREHPLPSPLDELVATDAASLARLLTPAALASLNTASILRLTELPQFSSSTGSLNDLEEHEMITLERVKEYILKSRDGLAPDGHRVGVGGIDVALHLYRMSHGGLDLWIDGISLYR